MTPDLDARLREAVARAICVRDNQNPDNWNYYAGRRNYQLDADAAIAAARPFIELRGLRKQLTAWHEAPRISDTLRRSYIRELEAEIAKRGGND